MEAGGIRGWRNEGRKERRFLQREIEKSDENAQKRRVMLFLDKVKRKEMHLGAIQIRYHIFL